MTRRVLAAAAIVASALAASPAAQHGVFTAEELAASPYALLHGERDIPERSARHLQLAGLAERAGDYPRAARHFAIACDGASAITRDATLSAPPCLRARELATRHDLLEVKVQLHVVSGFVRLWSLNLQGAIAIFEEAIVMGASLNPDLIDHAPINGAHHGLGAALVEVGRFDEAQQHLVFERDHCRVSGNSLCAAYADMVLCRMHAVLGDFGRARDACNTAAVEAAVSNDVLARANLGWMVGTLEAFLGRPAESLAALRAGWLAAQNIAGQGLQPILAQLIVDALVRLNRLDEAETWQRELDRGLQEKRIPFPFGPQIAMRRAQIAAARGRFDEAEAAYQIGSRSLIHEMSIRGHLGVARMSVLSGRLDGARAALERAIARIERSRTNLSGSVLRAGYFALHANAYRELAGIRYDAEGDAAAPAILEIAEAGRARSLLDALASAQVSGVSAPKLAAPDLQALLGPESVLVEYVSTERRLLAITVTQDRIAVVPLPGAGTADDLAKRVDFFSALVQESDNTAIERPAARLYEDLLAPLLAGVGEDVRTLIIAPDGPLHRLPFDAVGTPPLVERWNVATVPSASVLATPEHQGRSFAALVVAASTDVTGLAPLAAAGDEAGAIRDRVGGGIVELSGSRATLDAVTGQSLDQFAVLHFASHAVVDEERPLRSALMFSGANGQWTAEDIYRKKLRADLVVLSACSTAAGASAPGEGVMSLSRAFLAAGARATIATLWDVPDAPGPIFADVLYRRLAAGDALGVAAAEARRELRRRGAPPRAWAAYVVTGNPATHVAITPALSRRTVAAGVTGSLAVVLLLAAFMRRATPRTQRAALATAAVSLATVAVGLEVAPIWMGTIRPDVSRSSGSTVVAATLTDARLAWVPLPTADEYIVELFDPTGAPLAATPATGTSFDVPATAAGGWVRVEARRTGQALARSALHPVTK